MNETDAALIEALAQNAAFDGWTQRSLRAALSSLARDPAEAKLVFSGGPGDMIEAYVRLIDEKMSAATQGLEAGLTVRVRDVIAKRFELMRGDKEAIRRALLWLALPGQALRAARITANTVDAIWHAAGDTSADFSWYTKRATMAAVYGATLLYWLSDTSMDDEKTLAFLERRLKGTVNFIKFRKRLTDRLPRPRFFGVKAARTRP